MKDEAGFIEFNFNDQNAKCLNSRIKEFEGKPSFVEKEEGTKGS